MARRKKFGELTPRAKARAYAAGGKFQLSKQQVARRYNAGTYNPFARRDPMMRVPAELRDKPLQISETGQITVNWLAAAESNMLSLLADPGGVKFNEATILENVARASEKVQRVMALATVSELTELASIQKPEDAPDDMPFDLTGAEIFYVKISQKTGKHEWYNIFWYH